MQETTNLRLKKPELTDFANIQDINDNMDTLDALLPKLDYLNVAYGTCVTASTTAAKIITLPESPQWKLEAGAIIGVKFTYTNTASGPTFNVNDTGAKSVWYNTALITTSNLAYAGTASVPMFFMYDGVQFVFLGWAKDANDSVIYTNASLGQGYGTCPTAAAATVKAVTLSDYTLSVGGIVSVKFTYAVPADASLNINSTGAKPVYFNGTAITSDIIKAGDLATFIYNGVYFHLIALNGSVVSAGSYGPSANATLVGGGSFIVPEISVDATGRVIGATARTLTFPSEMPPSSHTHSAGDITGGTLDSARLPTVPLTKGGTGQTTAAKGLYALINGADATTASYIDDIDYIGFSGTLSATGKKILVSQAKKLFSPKSGTASCPAASSWSLNSTTGLYYVTVSLTGVLATHKLHLTPTIDTSDTATGEAQQEAWDTHYYAESVAGGVKFYAEEAPTVAVTFTWEAVI